MPGCGSWCLAMRSRAPGPGRVVLKSSSQEGTAGLDHSCGGSAWPVLGSSGGSGWPSACMKQGGGWGGMRSLCSGRACLAAARSHSRPRASCLGWGGQAESRRAVQVVPSLSSGPPSVHDESQEVETPGSLWLVHSCPEKCGRRGGGGAGCPDGLLDVPGAGWGVSPGPAPGACASVVLVGQYGCGSSSTGGARGGVWQRPMTVLSDGVAGTPGAFWSHQRCPELPTLTMPSCPGGLCCRSS